MTRSWVAAVSGKALPDIVVAVPGVCCWCSHELRCRLCKSCSQRACSVATHTSVYIDLNIAMMGFNKQFSLALPPVAWVALFRCFFDAEQLAMGETCVTRFDKHVPVNCITYN